MIATKHDEEKHFIDTVKTKKLKADTKLFLLISAIVFVIFVFSNDAHRYTIDEDFAQKQAMYIATEKPGQLYRAGNSTVLYEFPNYFPHPNMPICQNAILCSPSTIGNSLTEVPFLLVNDHLHIITSQTVVFSLNDFSDSSYVSWRNSIDPDFTFLQLFYGPVFLSLTTGIFFLVCRSFNFNQKNSLMLAFIFGFSTLVWPYSKTSLNMVPHLFFILLGFLFFKKFQLRKSTIDLLFCGIFFGFDFLVRLDAVLIMVPLFFYLLYGMRKQSNKVKKFFSFIIPPAISFVIYTYIEATRYSTPVKTAVAGAALSPISIIPGQSAASILPQGLFGLLFSPGVGLFIFAPIFLTVFFSFPDFYKKNKAECLLFLSIITLFMLYYGAGEGGWWHGLLAWGPRYLVPVMPFLLLPLGSSLEIRKNKILKTAIISLCAIGFFFNIVYMIQDVNWFVWGNASLHTGLFGLSYGELYDLNIHPAIIWTFQYSQLTQSIITAFTALQPDIYLLKLLGATFYGTSLSILLISLSYFLFRILRSNTLKITG